MNNVKEIVISDTIYGKIVLEYDDKDVVINKYDYGDCLMIEKTKFKIKKETLVELRDFILNLE